MKITLERLILKNFKGVRDVMVEFGLNTILRGRNETGKTTQLDAFLWLLFDKDSQNKKDFGIKTLDENNQVIRGLEHEVEGRLVVNGRVVTLRKVFAEKWTKKRGAAEQEFTGHSTDYFIDGVPTKQKDYKAYIDSLIDENLFKLLTSPTYFNEQLSWQDRRKTLLDVCGDVSDEEVIDANESLAKLPAILNGRNIEDHRKVIAARRADINKELDKIPVRIDEANRSKPNLDGLSETQLQSEIDQLKFEVETKESELNRLQSGGEVSVQENRAREIEGELLKIRNRAQAGSLQGITNQRIAIQEIEEQISGVNFQIRGLQREIGENEQRIHEMKADAARLREEWVEVNEQEPAPHIDTNCIACGQELPADEVQAAHDKATAEFNRAKSERLERIAERGKAATYAASKLEDLNEGLSAQLDESHQKLPGLETELDLAKQKLDDLQSQVQDVTNDHEYIAKQQELDGVKSKIVTLRQSVHDDVQRVRGQLMDLRDELRRKETAFASFAQVRTLDARIEELKGQERQLAAEYEQLEQELYLTEEFIRTKVSMLEERINNQFRYARFKLFETQINGGLQETCQTLYKGVPYGSGLNAGGRILVGVDIVRTLQQHYGISVPVWVDNRESVTSPLEADCQLIELVVDEKVDKLRVETQDLIREAV